MLSMLIAAFTSLFHTRLHDPFGQRFVRHAFTVPNWESCVKHFEHFCDVKFSLIITTLARSRSAFTHIVDQPPFHDAARRDHAARLASPKATMTFFCLRLSLVPRNSATTRSTAFCRNVRFSWR